MKKTPKKDPAKTSPSNQVRIRRDLFAYIEKQAKGYETFSDTLARVVGFNVAKK